MDQELIEKTLSDWLRRYRDALAVHESALAATAKSMTTPGDPRPVPGPARLKEILKAASTAIGEAAEIVSDHVDGTVRVSKGPLHWAARTISAAKEVLDPIILVDAVGALTR